MAYSDLKAQKGMRPMSENQPYNAGSAVQADNPQKDKPKSEETEDAAIVAQVRKWTKKIRDSRDKFEPEFKRMRRNMDFVAGIQWPGQRRIEHAKYVANLTNRTVNQKVSMLYAKDPKAVYRRRKRMLYQLWDEKLESLGAAVQRASAVAMHGMPEDVEALAIIQDYTNGLNFKQLIDSVGRTLEILYQYQVDEQEPSFKTQMKQLVRRVIVCGVGYVKVNFERNYEGAELSQTNVGGSFPERALRAKYLLGKLEEQKFDEQSADFEELRQLFSSLGQSIVKPGVEGEQVNERLVFDFVPSTSIIVDPACRNLKGFVGAHWLVQEYILPLDYVNACFDVDIAPGGKLVQYSEKGEEQVSKSDPEANPTGKTKVCLWEVFNKDNKERFLIVDGFTKYVVKPEPLEPETHGFWPIRALTFNDIETDGQNKASIYPPSDVDMLKHAQVEWNQSREDMRNQKGANTPFYVTGKGWLTQGDLDKIHNKQPNEVIELENLTKGDDVNEVLAAFKPAPIDPAVYDVTPYRDDILFANGTQEANLGPAKANVTATVGSIAEQSRMTMAGSNVDDLDDLLSDLARMGGEMLLREMGKQNVSRVVGPGAVWPEANREDYLNAIYLETMAASSGRPNKAIEIANMRELGPLLIQLGANPQFLVREMIKRLDERMDPEEAFPLVPPDGKAATAKNQTMTLLPQSAPPPMPGGAMPPPMAGANPPPAPTTAATPLNLS